MSSGRTPGFLGRVRKGGERFTRWGVSGSVRPGWMGKEDEGGSKGWSARSSQAAWQTGESSAPALIGKEEQVYVQLSRLAAELEARPDGRQADRVRTGVERDDIGRIKAGNKSPGRTTASGSRARRRDRIQQGEGESTAEEVRWSSRERARPQAGRPREDGDEQSRCRVYGVDGRRLTGCTGALSLVVRPSGEWEMDVGVESERGRAERERAGWPRAAARR